MHPSGCNMDAKTRLNSNPEILVSHRHLLEQLPAFSRLPASLLDALMAGATLVSLPAHALLFQAGTLLAGFHVLVTGRVELTLPDQAGNERKVLMLLEPGTTLGETALLLNQPSPVTATTLEPATLLFFPKTLLHSSLRHYPQLGQRLLVLLSRQLHTLIDDIAGYTQHTAEQRLAEYLLNLLADSPSASTEIVLPTNKQILASRLSIAPATLSRILKRLRERGIITIRSRRIVICDQAALKQLAACPATPS